MAETTNSYRLAIDQDECMSSGKCVADYPAEFEFDEEELALLRPEAQSLSDSDILRVARNCPSRAIIVLDADGNSVPV